MMNDAVTIKGYDAVESALINGSLADAFRVAIALSEVSEGFEAPEASNPEAATVRPVKA